MDIAKHAGKSKSYVNTDTSSDIKLTGSVAKTNCCKKETYSEKKISVV